MLTITLIFLIIVSVFILFFYIRKRIGKTRLKETNLEREHDIGVDVPEFRSHKEASITNNESIWEGDGGLIADLSALAEPQDNESVAEKEQQESKRLRRLAGKRKKLHSVESRWNICFYSADDLNAPLLSYSPAKFLPDVIWEAINRENGQRITGTVPLIAGEQLAIVTVLEIIAKHEDPSMGINNDKSGSSPGDAKKFLENGYEFQKQGRLNDAIEQYQHALKIDPDYAEAHNNIGTVYLELNHIDDAIRAFKEALRINPEFDAAHYNLGDTLFNQGRLEESMAHIQQSLKINPEYDQANLLLGRVLWKLGRKEEAITSYKEALRINKEYSAAHFHLGNSFYELGRLDEAILHLRQSIRINTKSVDAYFILATVLLKSGKFEEAIPICERFLEIAPPKDWAESIELIEYFLDNQANK